jgi:hypothetical protein
VPDPSSRCGWCPAAARWRQPTREWQLQSENVLAEMHGEMGDVDAAIAAAMP